MKKTNKIITLMVIAASTLIVSCTEDNAGMNMAPGLTLGTPSETFRTGTTLNATVINTDGRQIVESGFIVSKSSDFQYLTMEEVRESKNNCLIFPTKDVVTQGEMHQMATELFANTQYYYQAYVSSGYSVQRSALGEFTTTQNNDPVFTAVSVSDITLNSASTAFQVLDIGGEDQMKTTSLHWCKVGEGEVISDFTKGQSVDGSSGNVMLYNLDKNTRYAVWATGVTDGTAGDARTGHSSVTYFYTENYDASFGDLALTTSNDTIIAHSSYSTSEEVVGKGIMYSLESEEPNEKNLVIVDGTEGTSISAVATGLYNGVYHVRPFVRIKKDAKLFYIYGPVKAITVNQSKKPSQEDIDFPE